MKMSELPAVDRHVKLSQLGEFAKRLSVMTDELRDQILAPRPRKTAPVFTIGELTDMCGIDRQKINYLATKEGGDLPRGEAHGTGRSRIFTLAEARTWVQQVSNVHQTALVTGQGHHRGRVLITANFKGGSCKTTTTMCIGQCLSLRGRRILVIDLDPQASLSELCGLYAEKDVTWEDTVLPFIYDPAIEGGLGAKVQTTYWDGLDVIPSHNYLHDAEFHLPTAQKENPEYEFWSVLRRGIEPLRAHYDYIILDTAPSLSYMTLNGLMAADAMVMPLVPESLDFISSVSFWSLFSEVAAGFVEHEFDKTYDFISVLLSKVDYGTTSSAPVVRSWAQRAYGDWLATTEIPASSVMSNGALAFSTVFDLSRADGVAKTLARVKQPLMDYCKWIDDQYVAQWRAEA
ncbi:ParA family protein [Burkholderia ubonensis]|uniref:ParA family protein n=1 Tax=Burkholderia ubonensis TaxID=101571 RepID=UPI00075E0B33|nr:AAA family ATPase [Burkholderia ubonensis]KVD60244.1 plasmid partition protein A [Burkholderia ubonensis]KVP68175.1 plasmid partition protein A [Burkholderia ubonensis]KVR54977.1 plasmid partition protein A [Burkholderia ubonensis]KVU19925.1 plasmid partition protein A [Burkholderia ubonensis]KVU35993.1 plasmid partition protein A [Burkholderia ubonensis]